MWCMTENVFGPLLGSCREKLGVLQMGPLLVNLEPGGRDLKRKCYAVMSFAAFQRAIDLATACTVYCCYGECTVSCTYPASA